MRCRFSDFCANNLRLLAIVFLLVNPSILHGAGRLVINEIMINEPGSETSLEWVELFNAGEDSVDLKSYIFIEASDTTLFTQRWLHSHDFVILSRKPLTTDGTASFERQWGNASNTWGDDLIENFLLLSAKMSLRNSNDSVTIVDLSSGRIETVKWSTSPPDGVSLERVNPSTEARSKNFKYCKAAALSTPGRTNSVVAKMRDWGFIEDDCEIFVPSRSGTAVRVQSCHRQLWATSITLAELQSYSRPRLRRRVERSRFRHGNRSCRTPA